MMNHYGSGDGLYARTARRNHHWLSTKVRNLTEDDFNNDRINARFHAEAQGGKLQAEARAEDQRIRNIWEASKNGVYLPVEKFPKGMNPRAYHEYQKRKEFAMRFESPYEMASVAIQRAEAARQKPLTVKQASEIQARALEIWKNRDLWDFDERVRERVREATVSSPPLGALVEQPQAPISDPFGYGYGYGYGYGGPAPALSAPQPHGIPYQAYTMTRPHAPPTYGPPGASPYGPPSPYARPPHSGPVYGQPSSPGSRGPARPPHPPPFAGSYPAPTEHRRAHAHTYTNPRAAHQTFPTGMPDPYTGAPWGPM